MENKFEQFVLERLRDMTRDIEGGLEPAEPALQEVIYAHLRRDYERELVA